MYQGNSSPESSSNLKKNLRPRMTRILCDSAAGRMSLKIIDLNGRKTGWIMEESQLVDVGIAWYCCCHPRSKVRGQYQERNSYHLIAWNGLNYVGPLYLSDILVLIEKEPRGNLHSFELVMVEVG